LKKLEDHRRYSTLRERLEDEEWVGVYLDLTEQQFWLDPAEGVRYALLFMIVATIYLRSAITDIIEIGKFFIGSVGSPYRNWWQWAIQRPNRYLSRGTPTGLDNLVNLESQSYLPRSHPLSGFEMEIKALLWWRLGDAHRVKNKNKALTWYEKALTVLPDDSELKEVTARTYWDVANHNEKRKHAERLFFLNRAIELKSDYVAAYYSRGIVYSHQKKYQEAIADFDFAIELDPGSAFIYVQRGITYRHQKKYQEAIADFERAIELDPRSAWAYLQRGITYGHHDEHQRAMIDFDHAIELEPRLDRAYVRRGRAYRWRKEYQRAIADFDSAIALDPNYAWAYASRSQVYTDLGKYQEAIAGFDLAIALEPSSAGTYKLRGDTYLWMKNRLKATADYRHCYELDPTRDDAAWMLEWASMGKHRPGVDTAERLEAIAAIERKPFTMYILNVCLGLALGLRGNLKDGLAELERALKLESEVADCYFWKGMLSAYYYRGRPHTAIELIEKSLAMGLPPLLLTPLHWLEKDLPDFYEQYAAPLLTRYGV
jgi:tetratricopeptide (TPR) repeat protein